MALLTAPQIAFAANPQADTTEEARLLFIEGQTHLHSGKYAEAVEKLERSLTLVPSPNTELLLGRALVKLGRKADALQAFDHAEADARRRAQAGESKYTQTADAAHAEAADLKSQLGSLRIRLADPAHTTLTVDGKQVAVPANGDVQLVHDVGRAEIVVRDAAGAEQRQIATIVAGKTAEMEFGGTKSTPQPPPPPTTTTTTRSTAPREPIDPGSRGSTRPWAVPAAIVAGGVTLVGAGAFTFFGLRVESAYSDLSDRCGPTFCGTSADREKADQAKRDQTAANVSLAVGAVAAAATITFVILAVTAGPADGSNAKAAAKAQRVIRRIFEPITL